MVRYPVSLQLELLYWSCDESFDFHNHVLHVTILSHLHTVTVSLIAALGIQNSITTLNKAFFAHRRRCFVVLLLTCASRKSWKILQCYLTMWKVMHFFWSKRSCDLCKLSTCSSYSFTILCLYTNLMFSTIVLYRIKLQAETIRFAKL